jgi:hypothetical protein
MNKFLSMQSSLPPGVAIPASYLAAGDSFTQLLSEKMRIMHVEPVEKRAWVFPRKSFINPGAFIWDL